MENFQINQDVKNVISLMGKRVSFVQNTKIGNQFLSFDVDGLVTEVILSIDGVHQILVDQHYFVLSDLLEFQVLDPK